MSTNALQVTDMTADLPAIFELAKHLVPSGMLPDHVKTPGQAVAIILAGRELGMPPMRSLRSLVLVKGKVVESADSQLARFKADGGKASFTHLDDTRAVLKLTHPNGDEHGEAFTIDDAKRAGLMSNPTWQKYPKAMLRSRVITAGLKSIGWDGAVGNYDPDEAREINGGKPVATVEAAPVVQMPRRKSEAQQAAIPVTPEVQEVADGMLRAVEVVGDDDIEELLQASIDAQQAQPDEPITQAQVARMMTIAHREGGHAEAAVKAWLKSQGFASRKAIAQSKYGAICDRLADPLPLEV